MAALFCRWRVLGSSALARKGVGMAGCGDMVIGQLEFYWDFHLWPRLQGLTDDEYLWEPAEGAWSVRPDESGQIVVDHEDPVPDPPPLTTIAWRLVHVGVGCFATRVSTF